MTPSSVRRPFLNISSETTLPVELKFSFLYRHFKSNGHSPSKIVIQPLEKIIYDPNSSTRLKNIKRHETELKWIKFLQSPFPLGFNDNIYHEGNISKMPDFDGFFFCFGM